MLHYQYGKGVTATGRILCSLSGLSVWVTALTQRLGGTLHKRSVRDFQMAILSPHNSYPIIPSQMIHTTSFSEGFDTFYIEREVRVGLFALLKPDLRKKSRPQLAVGPINVDVISHILRCFEKDSIKGDMVRSVGLDLVEIERIAHNVHTYGQRFLKKILGPYELRLYEIRQDKVLFVAGRFAAKEAIVKGLGQFLDKRPSLWQIQIVNDATGKPHVDLLGAVPDLSPKIKCHLSITHERKHAAAVAIFVEE